MKKLSDMTRTELLAECKKRELSGAGSNDDLIDRIEAYDAENADPMLVGDDEAPDDAAESEAAPADANVQPDAAGEQADSKPAQANPDPNDGFVAPSRFRREFPLGDRSIDDNYHMHLIGETHAAAAAAGYRPRGGVTVGHRVRYAADATGRRTVVYEVHVQSPDGPNGLRRP